MRINLILAILISSVLFACNKEKTPTNVPIPIPVPTEPVLLKDIVIPNLPSPYYHFEYDNTKKITKASFSSGFRMYDVVYDGNKINELKHNTAVNKDRLQYIYNNEGKPAVIKYINEAGVHYRTCFLSYSGDRLTEIEWNTKQDPGFILDRAMTFTYYADGNLLKLTDHKFPVQGQPDFMLIDRFEQYDNKVNTDGFSLIHKEGEHLLLLPGIQLQKNNPAKLVRSGTGLNYTIDYTYTYNDKKAVVSKTGDAVFTNGPNAGQRFQVNATLSYYQ